MEHSYRVFGPTRDCERFHGFRPVHVPLPGRDGVPAHGLGRSGSTWQHPSPMCGRFALAVAPSEVRELFDAESVPASPDPALTDRPRYNVAPTQPVLVARRPGTGSPMELAWATWSFLPFDRKVLINARAETVFERSSFGRAARERRCLVPASGFFEWKAEGKTKQPHFVAPAEGGLWTFGGITQTWRAADGSVHEGLAILTCTPNPKVRTLHDRMPVILPPSAWRVWTDPSCRDPSVLRPWLSPVPQDQVQVRPVSTRVNRVANDDPSILDPLRPATEQSGQRSASKTPRQLDFDW